MVLVFRADGYDCIMPNSPVVDSPYVEYLTVVLHLIFVFLSVYAELSL